VYKKEDHESETDSDRKKGNPTEDVEERRLEMSGILKEPLRGIWKRKRN